ncbi:hypothetical protein T09_9703 [Trichinella sp. T9]|nr:hypothetical protein T09_9703 [Trichinella sp. T9]
MVLSVEIKILVAHIEQASSTAGENRDDILMALVCLLRYCQLSEFRRMAASEAATVIGQFYCATLDSSRQDVGIAECDSNSAAPHPASSNAALFVLTIFSSI